MNSAQCKLVQCQLENVLNFLEPLLGLANCHLVDYFTKNLYSKFLSKQISDEVTKLGYKESVDLILKSEASPRTPHLNNFIKQCKSYSLYNFRQICPLADSFTETLHHLGGKDVSKLKLGAFVSEKKSHEIEVLSAIVATLTDIVKSSHIIDIGDGKGYLSSMLAFNYNVPVLGVDASLTNTSGAIKRAQKLGKVWRGVTKNPNRSQLPQEEQNFNTNTLLYKQVTQYVTEETDFTKLISDVFIEESLNLGLVGLHTCGNLAPASLRIFNASQDIKTICNVSCCYHLMTERYELDSGVNKSVGFPMSKFVLERDFQLGRSARMLSAQSIDRILNNKEVSNQNVFYRAVLQVLLHNYCIELPSKNVGRTKKRCYSFIEYVRNALSKLDVDLVVSDKELNDLFELYAHREDEMNAFYLIRCMLAPVVEALILLDRLLFLYEQGHERSYLVQLFDPVISPRCYGIISLKS